MVIILKFVDLEVDIKRDKKEIEIEEPEHTNLKGNVLARASDSTDGFDGDESANVDKNPSKTLTNKELAEIKRRNNERHQRAQEKKDELLPLNNNNGTWKRIGNTTTNF